jgi:hypothetical protein
VAAGTSRLSAPARVRTRIGSAAPTIASEPRGPASATIAGASIAPAPVVSQYELSTTPNARARTSSWASRCISVMPADSVSA